MESDIACLTEIFPSWSHEDLFSLYQDYNRDISIVIDRINEGHASQWTTKCLSNDEPIATSMSNVSTKSRNSASGRVGAPKKNNARKRQIQKKSREDHELLPVPSNDAVDSHASEGAVSKVADQFVPMSAQKEEDSSKIDIVTLPPIIGYATSTIIADIVVLPSVSHSNSFPIELPIVSLPLSLRNRTGEPWQELTKASYPSHEKHSEISSLDDLFPDSVRLTRSISRMNTFNL